MSVIGGVRRESFPQRGERRFLVDEMMARLILGILGRHLDLATEERSTPWRTTVYCDTPDRQIYRAAESGAGMFMRFREYHSGRPQSAFSGAKTWLELKPIDELSGKTRYAVPSHSIPALLRGDVELRREASEPDGGLRQLLDAGVRPLFATQYHRVAYAARDAVRITADRELSYAALPHWDASNDEAVPCLLGPILSTEYDVVIEMKWEQALPDWAVTVGEFLRPYALKGDDRKFVIGMRHLQGRASSPAPQAAGD